MLLLTANFSAQAVIFECRFSLGEWVVIGDVYNCDATVTSLSNDSLLLDVSGDHLPGKNNTKVETLNLSFQNLSHIPQNIAYFFPNIEGIQWYTSNLLAIAAADLKQFPNLKVFSSISNRLMSLPGDIFLGTPQLRWISFYGNSLENVGRDLLNDLYYLSFANFYDNTCISKIVTSREEMGQLIEQLLSDCPPLLETTTIATTTEAEDCQLRCSLNDEVNAVSIRLSGQEEKISELEKAVAGYEERIAELERIIADLTLSFNSEIK